MISTDTLKIIAERDPDGRDTRPTDAALDGFRQWVKRTYGVTVWRAYLMQGV